MTLLRTRWLPLVAGVALALATASLGFWQLGRADQKRAAAALLTQRQQAAPMASPQWACGDEAPRDANAQSHVLEQAVHRVVRLQGQWDALHTAFLDNRPMDGTPGFIVVTPLKLSGPGACAGRVVLVQRGWLPRDPLDRQRLPQWDEASREVRVEGRVAAQLSRTYAVGEEALPEATTRRPIRQNADEAFWRHWLGQAPLPGVVLQTRDDGSLPLTLTLSRHWPAPDLGVGKHQGYAAQWFAMSAVALGLTGWFGVWRPWRVRRAASK